MNSFKHGLFIYNGKAGSNAIKSKLASTLPFITEAIEELMVIQLKRAFDAEEVCRQYGKWADIVIILGGDGTVHKCINGLAELENSPVIAILPGGTCNDFSRALGIPQNLELAAQTIVGGRIAPVDLAKANNRYFSNFAGIGLVAETSENINEQTKEHFGVISYFLSTFKTIKQAEPFSFLLKIDGEVCEEEGVMVLILNGNFLGTREIPLPMISHNDGMLDVLIVKNSNLNMMKEWLSLSQLQEDQTNFSEIEHMEAAEVEIITNQPKPTDMDGEVYLRTPLHINVLPNHFKFIHGS